LLLVSEFLDLICSIRVVLLQLLHVLVSDLLFDLFFNGLPGTLKPFLDFMLGKGPRLVQRLQLSDDIVSLVSFEAFDHILEIRNLFLEVQHDDKGLDHQGMAQLHVVIIIRVFVCRAHI